MKNKNNDLINNLKAEISKEIKRKVYKQYEKLAFFKIKCFNRCLNCVNVILIIR